MYIFDLAGLGIKLFIFSLKSNGHIYYVSDEKVGILGLIDASECPPTYGCRKINYFVYLFL